MQELLQFLYANSAGVADTVSSALVAGILAAVGFAVRRYITHDLLKEVALRVAEAVSTAVGEVAQVYLEEIRKASADGTITKEEAKTARDMALEKALTYLGPKGLATLKYVLGDEESAKKWIMAKIEAKVLELKTKIKPEINITIPSIPPPA